MNTEIRKYLIDSCVTGKPIFYEDVANKIGITLDTASNRDILSKTLGVISAFEYQNNRPLISAIAIYKTNEAHGSGFFKLCEKLGIGKASKLEEELFGVVQIKESEKFWKDPANYSLYYELDDNKKYSLPFFNLAELEFFKKWANVKYIPEDSDHFNAKEYLMETVWAKTQLWSNRVIEKTLQYTTSNGRYWSKPDWSDGKRVAGFKHYTWARIYKFGDKDKDIFFTIGVDALKEALIYKLDYFHESKSKLNEEQKMLCQQYIPEDIKWKEIPFSELDNYNWTKLIKQTVDFISENTQYYDQLIDAVWKGVPIQDAFNNSLTLRGFPKGGLSKPPNYKPSFNGTEVDFISKNIEAKELGDAGEELVRDYEFNRLASKGMINEAKAVKIVKDGKGYDVLSFDDNGNELYIEVKSTTGNEKTPFYFSRNELAFSELNSESYKLFRIYNYDDDNNRGDFFIIENISLSQHLVPINYLVYIKKQ